MGGAQTKTTNLNRHHLELNLIDNKKQLKLNGPIGRWGKNEVMIGFFVLHIEFQVYDVYECWMVNGQLWNEVGQTWNFAKTPRKTQLNKELICRRGTSTWTNDRCFYFLGWKFYIFIPPMPYKKCHQEKGWFRFSKAFEINHEASTLHTPISHTRKRQSPGNANYERNPMK